MLIFKHYDQGAMKLGMIQAFCEMVMQGVKKLAFSPILDPEEWERLAEDARAVADHFHVKDFVEPRLMSSDLVPDQAVRGKIVILYYKDPAVLESYLRLKAEVEALEAEDAYDQKAREDLSKELRRLLGYP